MELIDKDELIEAMGEEPLVWNDEADEIAERMQWQIDMSIIEAAPTIERCEDAISRKGAIDTFIAWEKREFGYSDLNRGERFISAIESLPSVAPSRRGGDWIDLFEEIGNTYDTIGDGKETEAFNRGIEACAEIVRRFFGLDMSKENK